MVCSRFRAAEVLMQRPATHKSPSPTPDVPRPDAPTPLERVAARVREDAKRSPREYLEDARVPAGGE